MQSQVRTPLDRPGRTVARAGRPAGRLRLVDRLGRLAAAIGAILLSGALQPVRADVTSSGAPRPLAAVPNGAPSSGLLESQLSGSTAFADGSSADDPNYAGPRGSSSLSQSTTLGENGQMQIGRAHV